MITDIGNAINTVKPFNNGTGYATSGALNAAKAGIATALGNNATDANITEITATQTQIVITTNLNLTDNSSGISADAPVNGVTLKAVISGTNTITITNNASGSIWTSAS